MFRISVAFTRACHARERRDDEAGTIVIPPVRDKLKCAILDEKPGGPKVEK